MSDRVDRFIYLLAKSRPVRLIGEFGPERVVLNFACALIGFGGLLEAPGPDSMLAHWPRWAAYEWSAGMLIGGLFALWGIVAGGRVREWIGYVCIGVAAVAYGVTALLFGAERIGVLFLCIALAKAVRLLLNYGARAGYLHRAVPEQEGAGGAS